MHDDKADALAQVGEIANVPVCRLIGFSKHWQSQIRGEIGGVAMHMKLRLTFRAEMGRFPRHHVSGLLNDRWLAVLVAFCTKIMNRYLQADIAADLIRRGLNVHAFNQRSVDGILDMIRMLGAMIDANGRAEELLATLEAGLVQLQAR